jgi:methylglyoxal synthase
MPDQAPAPARRRIALIAHDNKKRDMLEWAEYNLDLLHGHDLFATATTGHLLAERLGLPVTCFRSGPYGGDQQIGARIAEVRSTCWCSSGTRSSRTRTTRT